MHFWVSYLDCILIMQVYNQLRSGLGTVNLAFSTIFIWLVLLPQGSLKTPSG